MSSIFSPQLLEYRGSKVISDLELQFNLSTFSETLSPEEQKTLKELNVLYTSNIQLKGGSPNYHPNQWTQWVNTVDSNAIPISLDMRLLSSIVPSQYSDRISAINEAINAYLSYGSPAVQPSTYPTPSRTPPTRSSSSPTPSYSPPPFAGGIWFAGIPMPQPNAAFGMGIIGQQLYVVGGRNGQINSKCYSLSLSSGMWSSVPDLPYALSHMGFTVVNGNFYLIAGLGNFGPTNIVLSYSPGSTSWRQMTNYPFSDSDIAAVTVGESIYCFGGFTNFVQIFNPTTNSWSQKGSIPTLRKAPQAVMVNNIIYIMGGVSSSDGQILSLVQSYDPSNGEWQTKAPMPSPTAYGTASVSNGMIYYFGGSNGTMLLNTLQIYNPSTDSWTLGTPDGIAAEFQRATTLSNSTIFVMGGITTSAYLSDTLVYEPKVSFKRDQQLPPPSAANKERVRKDLSPKNPKIRQQIKIQDDVVVEEAIFEEPKETSRSQRQTHSSWC